MEQKELEKVFEQNDNQAKGPCFMPEPEQLKVPVDPEFIHIEEGPSLTTVSLAARWIDN